MTQGQNEAPGIGSGSTTPTGGWTPELVLLHLMSVINERDKRYEQRFVGQENANARALEAATIAVNKAETASDRNFEELASKIDEIGTRLDRREGGGAGLKQAWLVGVAAIGVIMPIISMAIILASR